MFKAGDLIRWNHHGPGEGKICKIKEIIGDKFTLEDDPYIGHQYNINQIRVATYEELNQIVPQIEFLHEKYKQEYYKKYWHNKEK